MRLRHEMRFAAMFACILALISLSSGRARAEYAGAFQNIATPDHYEEADEERQDLQPDTEEENTEPEAELMELLDDEETGDLWTKEEKLTATPGSYMEEKEKRAEEALMMGYAVYSTELFSAGASLQATSDQNNLECSILEAYAELTGPDTVVIHLKAAAEPMRFYGFEVSRNDRMDEYNLFMEEPDVVIKTPDWSTGTVPEVESVQYGAVRIDSFSMSRNRYGADRMLEISWEISGTEVLADFSDGLFEDTLFLNLGGEYILPGGGGEDVCSHHGPVTVTGLFEAVFMGGCPHTERLCSAVDELSHSVVCENCGYVFSAEEHHIVTGRCTDCGFEIIVSGIAELVLNGWSVEESYTGVEENPYLPPAFPGYHRPDPVPIPKGGGVITFRYDPVEYTVITDDDSFSLFYDESLFLAGGRRKGFTFEAYEVTEVF